MSFLATFIAATVVLVPKSGIDKKQTEIPQELEVSASEAGEAVEAGAKKDEGTIVLRKAKKEKVSKNSKGKKGKKKVAKDGPKTEYDNENLDDIYKKERKYFETGRGASKRKKSTVVNGPLASIPTAVADSFAQNIALATQARAPAAPPPPPPPAAPPTVDQVLNVEDTIQNKKKAKGLDKEDKKIVEAKEKKKKEKEKQAKEDKKDAKPVKKVEIKDELQQEVQSATVADILSSGSLPTVKADKVATKRDPTALDEDPKKILKKVETKYISHFVTIDVKSEVTQALLERTKTYSGKLYLAPEGKFKMDIQQPNKHMLLMNGKNIWVVDYPLDETQDKMQILHSKSAKNLKSQTFLSIFMGVGNIEKTFKVESSDKKNDEITYKLIPKKKDTQVERVELKLDYQAELISSITFWDSLGNKTQLRFTEQDFEEKTPKEIFKFKPPKDASITYL